MNFKELGNKAKQNGDIQEAIIFYTKAIEKDNSQSIFYSNRALCYKELGEIQKAMDDAQFAIEIDEKNIKAQFIMARCQLIRAQNEGNISLAKKGEKRLRHALGMCRVQNKNDFEKKIQVTIYRSRKLLFILKEKERLRKLEEFYKASSNKIVDDNTLDFKGKQRKLDLLDKFIDRDRYNYEIPQYFICEISRKLMLNPMITKYGNTYDKSSILGYIQTHMRDPKENKPLTAGEVYPNLAMRDAMELFLNENGWAYEFKNKNILFNTKIEF